ncbi:unnamed protein product, partial [Callosobruchus maculatus]
MDADCSLHNKTPQQPTTLFRECRARPGAILKSRIPEWLGIDRKDTALICATKLITCSTILMMEGSLVKLLVIALRTLTKSVAMTHFFWSEKEKKRSACQIAKDSAVYILALWSKVNEYAESSTMMEAPTPSVVFDPSVMVPVLELLCIKSISKKVNSIQYRDIPWSVLKHVAKYCPNCCWVDHVETDIFELDPKKLSEIDLLTDIAIIIRSAVIFMTPSKKCSNMIYCAWISYYDITQFNLRIGSVCAPPMYLLCFTKEMPPKRFFAVRTDMDTPY